MTKLPHALEATVEQIDKKESTLKTEDNHTISIPTKLLGEVAEGDTVYLMVLKGDDTEIEREKFAKQVLKEILEGE